MAGSGEEQQVSLAIGSFPCNLGKEVSSPQTTWWKAAGRGVS